MTGFMFILLVAMLLGIILMYIIDCHMAETADELDDQLNKVEYWEQELVPRHANCHSAIKPYRKDE